MRDLLGGILGLGLLFIFYVWFSAMEPINWRSIPVWMWAVFGLWFAYLLTKKDTSSHDRMDELEERIDELENQTEEVDREPMPASGVGVDSLQEEVNYLNMRLDRVEKQLAELHLDD